MMMSKIMIVEMMPTVISHNCQQHHQTTIIVFFFHISACAYVFPAWILFECGPAPLPMHPKWHLIGSPRKLWWPNLFLSCTSAKKNLNVTPGKEWNIHGSTKIGYNYLNNNVKACSLKINYNQQVKIVKLFPQGFSKKTKKQPTSPRAFLKLKQGSLYHKPITTPSSQVVSPPGASTRHRTRSPSRKRTARPWPNSPPTKIGVLVKMKQQMEDWYIYIYIYVGNKEMQKELDQWTDIPFEMRTWKLEK